MMFAYRSHSPTIKWIFAIIAFVKFTLVPLSSPDLVPSSVRVCPKVFVPFSVIAVDCLLCRSNRTVIAIVYDRSSHSAENRFDDVEELGPCREWSSFHNRISFCARLVISLFDVHSQISRNVPRSCVPGEIDRPAVAILDT